jgi:hypothetical protein
LTGIKTKFQQQLRESARPSFLSLRGISYRPATMLTIHPSGRNGANKISKVNLHARAFLMNFTRAKNSQGLENYICEPPVEKI